MDVQLTNPTLMSDNGRTHLLHFRSGNPQSSFFLENSKTRQQVEKMQGTRFADKYKKKKDDKDKKGPPGGGSGASSSSSKKGGGSKSGSSQQGSRRGGSSSSSSQTHQSRGGYSYSYTGQFYSEEGFPQHFGFLILQVWRGVFGGGMSLLVTEHSTITTY